MFSAVPDVKLAIVANALEIEPLEANRVCEEGELYLRAATRTVIGIVCVKMLELPRTCV